MLGGMLCNTLDEGGKKKKKSLMNSAASKRIRKHVFETFFYVAAKLEGCCVAPFEISIKKSFPKVVDERLLLCGPIWHGSS